MVLPTEYPQVFYTSRERKSKRRWRMDFAQYEKRLTRPDEEFSRSLTKILDGWL